MASASLNDLDTHVETWRPVLGLEGTYEVSDLGRVRSLDRWIKRRTSRRHPEPGGWLQFRKGKMMTPCPTSTGHMLVTLGKRQALVHHLVLEAFIEPRPKGREGLHWDDDPSNNRLSNLRWGTRLENIMDAFRNGGRKLGEALSHTKSKESQVRIVKANPAMGPRELSALSGLSVKTIYDIRVGKSWAWLKIEEEL